MIRNYLLTSLRTLRKNKAYTFINIIGLALGLGCSMVIFKVVRYEASFDSHQPNYDRIYRINSESTYPDRVSKSMGTPNPVGPAVMEEYPELSQVTRTYYPESDQINVRDENGELLKFMIDGGIAFAEHAFFEIFYTEWIAGDKATALTEPNTVVISKSMAQKLFRLKEGNEHLALDQIVDYKADFKVVGVIQDPLPTTNFEFHLIFEFDGQNAANPYYGEGKHWNSTSSGTNTYVLLDGNTDPDMITAKLPGLVEKYYDADEVNRRRFVLQPLSDIHFNSDYGAYSETVAIEFLYALGLVGVFLILTAAINFINLATAQAANRAKEIGIRKSIGSRVEQLISQFMSEVFLITFIATLVSLAISEIMFIVLEQVIGYRLQLDLLGDPMALAFLLLLLVVVSFISGIYPSFLLSRMNTIEALKSKISNKKTGGLSLRKGLVVLQFAISQFLIIGTLVVTAQMDYFSKKDLGFNQEAIINTYLPEQDESRQNRFREEMMQSPHVNDLTYMLSQPTGTSNSHSNLDYAPLNSEIEYNANFKACDEFYFDFFGLELLAGRKLQKGDSSNLVIINRKIANLMGFKDRYDEAVGETIITGWGGDKKVVGVMENFHTNSLDEDIDYTILIYEPRLFYQLSFKVSSLNNLEEGLAHYRQVWEEVYPEYVIEYIFFDEEIAKRYEAEQRTSALLKIFAIISIIIGCLGLYGLISFIALNRTKEIGVRKVLGASVVSILVMFTREIVMLTILAFLVAGPAAYFVIGKWLEGYAFSIPFDYTFFLNAMTITLLIALITIAHRSISTALINPAQTLKDE